MPRSGHHLLARILKRLYGDSLYYCEFYKVPNCCRHVPCNRGHAFLYQKSHDFDLTMPIIEESTGGYSIFYIIQVRNPLLAVMSDWELYVNQHPDTHDDTHNYSVFLADKAMYYKQFAQKWLLSPPINSLTVDYDELVSRPEFVIDSMIKYARLPINYTSIKDAVMSEIETVDGSHKFFSKRLLENSRFYNAELIAQFSSLLITECPYFRKWIKADRMELSNSVMFSHYLSLQR